MQTNPTNVVCKLKADEAGCRRYRGASKQQQCKEKATPAPMFLMIPLYDSDICIKQKELCAKPGRPVHNVHTSKCTEKLKFPEMRNGILFSRCYCVHRNGLQDSCPLNQCQGQEKCLQKPWPSCLPAKYLQSRHPEQYPLSN